MTDVAIADRAVSELAVPRPRFLGSVSGAWLLSAATVGSGVLAYVFHVVAARALGPQAYGLVAILWAVMFLAVVLLFRPLEQTASRAIADRLARGFEVRTVVRSVTLIYLALVALIVGSAAAAWSPGSERLFDGSNAYMVALVAGTAVYGAAYVVRGLCGGVQWFRGYGLGLLADGAVRLAVVVPVVFGATGSVAAAAIAAAAAGHLVAPVAVGRRALAPLLRHGHGDRFHFGSALGFAWPAAIMAAADQLLVNGAPLLVVASGGEHVSKTAAVVFAATMLVRVPVFVFQGVAASLLPNLTRLQAVDDRDVFRRAVIRTAAVLTGAALVILCFAATVGPTAMRIVYGSGFSAGRLELGLLGVGVGFYLAAATFSQAMLALDCGRAAALAWASAAIAFVGLYAALPGEALMRVAASFAIAIAFGVVLLAVPLARRMRRS